MKTRLVLFALALLAVFAPARASWYWPFGGSDDEDDPSKPVRLHRLLEKANDLIEQAEDKALEGDGEKALDTYREAIAEMKRIAAENPDRAETAEFAPLRNRIAACEAAMDSIRFAQFENNSRKVVLTDTTELQKKWNKRHGIEPTEEELREEAAKAKAEADAKKALEEKRHAEELAKAEADTKAAEEKRLAEEKAKAARTEPAPAKNNSFSEDEDLRSLQRATTKVLAPTLSGNPDTWSQRLKIASDEIRAKDYVAADLLLEQLSKERPNDLNALLLRAHAQSGLGSNYAAKRTLEKAISLHPDSFKPYYSLASVSLRLNDEGAARENYSKGRAKGGPVSKSLETKLGMK